MGSRRRAESRIGERYGRLEVLSIVERTSNGARYRCRCACGTETEVGSTNIGRTQSCGCLNLDAVASTRIWEVEFNRERQYARLRRHGGVPWTLTQEEFNAIVSQACAYCGAPPSRDTAVGRRPRPKRNGIDRVDNAVGYVLANCVPCCSICNKMKLTLSKDDFLAHVRRIVKHTGP